MTDLFCGFKGLLDPVHPHHRDEIRMGSIDGDPKNILSRWYFQRPELQVEATGIKISFYYWIWGRDICVI